MSMDLAKKTFSTQPDYLIAGNAEIVTAVKEASAALKRGAPVVLNSDGKLAAISVSGSSAPYTVTPRACTVFWQRMSHRARTALCTSPASSSPMRWCCPPTPPLRTWRFLCATSAST